MVAGRDDATFQPYGVSGDLAPSAAEPSQRPGPTPRSTATAAGAAPTSNGPTSNGPTSNGPTSNGPTSNGSPAPASAAVPQQRRRNDRLPPGPAPRPRIVEEPSILGLSRRSRGRVGSRLFTLFFVLVYAVILLDLINSLMHP
jgi:hypothetical protein